MPVIGSGRDAYRDFQKGDYGWAVFNTAMAVSDVFLVKSLVVAGGKIVAGTAFRMDSRNKPVSHTWKATRAWLGRTGQAAKGQPVHHAFFHRNQGIGKYVPDAIKNQPWNLMNMPSRMNMTGREFHNAVHGVGPNGFGIIGRAWYGTPMWSKPVGAYVTNSIENVSR